MKIIDIGTPNFMPKILDSDGKMKDWVEWSSCLDNILDHPRFLAYCNNEASITIVYYMTDVIYKIEAEMSKVTVEVKVITYAKWIKA